MEKTLFSLIFLTFFCCFASFSAQQSFGKDTYSSASKNDDGVVVAYPNPTKDFIFIKSKNAALKIKSVTFYSILGNQVAQYSVNMNSGEINLDRLKPGKYLMKYLLSDDTQKVIQIIKQ